MYRIEASITSSNDVEMLTVATWLKDTAGSKVSSATGNGTTHTMTFTIYEDTFNEMVSQITALKSEYAERLTYEFTMEGIV